MTEGIKGLRWHSRRGGGRRALWRASRTAIASEFPIPSRTLWNNAEQPTAEDVARIHDVCLALNREQSDWIKGKRRGPALANKPERGVVYFIRSGAHVKIGFTTDLEKRLSTLQTATVDGIELLGTIACTSDRERLFHINFGRCRHRGEWFRIEGDLEAFLRDRFMCARHGAQGAHSAP
jgi:hypothetical protein